MGTAVEKLLVRTREASENVALTRAHAGETVVHALRSLEQSLIEALDGDSLRGFSKKIGYGCDGNTLVPTVDRWLPADGREVIIVDKHGHFAMASRLDALSSNVRPVRDDELRAEWLDPIVRSLSLILARHIERSEKTAENYVRTSELAQVLTKMVAELP